MNENFKILLEAMIDQSSLSNVQKQVAKERIKMNVDVSVENFAKSKAEMQKQIASLAAYTKNVMGGAISDKEATKWANQFYKEMINGAKQTAKEQENLVSSMTKVREKTELTRQAEEKRQQVAQNNAINKSLDQEYAQRQKLKLQIDEINKAEQLGTNKSKVSSLTNDLKNYTNESKVVSEQITNLQNAHNALLTSQSNLLKGTGTESDLINSNKLLQEEYTKTGNVLKQLSSESKKLNQSDALFRTKSNSLNKIDTFLKENTALSKESINQFLRLRNAIESTDDGKALKNLNAELTNLQRNAKAAGETGRSFGNEMQNNLRKFSQWVSASAIFFGVQRAIKGVVNNVVELDKAMTSLYKVTDETDAKYNSFLQGAFQNSQKLGQSASSLVEQTAQWAKLGYSIDEASKLAETSSIYSNVGEVDGATSVSDLVTALKAFNLESSKSITIVDSLNELGNKYATSAADLGEGLKNSASALALGGMDINKSLALLTGGAEITQNAGELGKYIAKVA